MWNLTTSKVKFPRKTPSATALMCTGSSKISESGRQKWSSPLRATPAGREDNAVWSAKHFHFLLLYFLPE